MKKTTMRRMAEADWDGMAADVAEKIGYLKAISVSMDRDAQPSGPSRELADKLANDLLVPCVELLAKFCVSVQIDPPEEE